MILSTKFNEWMPKIIPTLSLFRNPKNRSLNEFDFSQGKSFIFTFRKKIVSKMSNAVVSVTVGNFGHKMQPSYLTQTFTLWILKSANLFGVQFLSPSLSLFLPTSLPPPLSLLFTQTHTNTHKHKHVHHTHTHTHTLVHMQTFCSIAFEILWFVVIWKVSPREKKKLNNNIFNFWIFYSNRFLSKTTFANKDFCDNIFWEKWEIFDIFTDSEKVLFTSVNNLYHIHLTKNIASKMPYKGLSVLEAIL